MKFVVFLEVPVRLPELASPTLFCKKVTGCCCSVFLLLIPAPEALAVSAPRPKKVLMMISIDECHTPARSCTATLGNFAKVTFDAISNTYSNLTPDLGKRLCLSSFLIKDSLTIL